MWEKIKWENKLKNMVIVVNWKEWLMVIPAMLLLIQVSILGLKEELDLWEKSGVNIASGTYAGPAKIEDAYQISVNGIANAISIINAIPEKLMLVTTADHIIEAHETGKYGIIFDFQDTTPFGTDLNKVDFFYNLGLRVVQLTYNLRNLVGDGCTEIHKSGLSYFGKELVSKLNDMKINGKVNISHHAPFWIA